MSDKTERDTRERERVVAEAIFRGLKRHRRYVSGHPAPHEKTTIDGEFYLMSVAREVLRALRDLDESS